MNLASAQNFLKEFQEAWKSLGCPWQIHGNSYEGWTRWFESAMLEIAKRNYVHCQNKQSRKARTDVLAGEWMKIDHIFLAKNEYDCFPVVAIEHENHGAHGWTRALWSDDGGLPPANAKAPIEWTLWKCLSVRTELSVLVAYPYEFERENALREFGKMLSGWKRQYDAVPNLLILMGWWTRKDTPACLPSIYEAYTSRSNGDGGVSLDFACRLPEAVPLPDAAANRARPSCRKEL